jgi:hypothetical protein
MSLGGWAGSVTRRRRETGQWHGFETQGGGMKFSTTRGEESGEEPTRRDMLRGLLSAGLLTTAVAGISALFAGPDARAGTTRLPQLPASVVLKALPADAPPALVAAIEDGCCITYTLDEHNCGSGSCPSGYCCYHVVSTDCGINEVTCIEVGCDMGDFSTGC